MLKLKIYAKRVRLLALKKGFKLKKKNKNKLYYKFKFCRVNHNIIYKIMCKNNIMPTSKIKEYFQQLREKKAKQLYEQSEKYRPLFES